MKFPKLFFIVLFTYFPIIMISFFIMDTGKLSITMNGYGVDSSGRLYLGKETRIEIYEDNKIVNTIYPMTSRAYAFTVQKDDILLLSNTTNVYTLDLQGKVLNKEKDEGTKTFNKLQWLGRKFKASNGDIYIKKWNFMRTKIVRVDGNNSETVYIMPLWEYILKLLYIAAIVFFAVSIPIILIMQAKREGFKSLLHLDLIKELFEKH